MSRMVETYPHAIWLNPQPQMMWEYTPSIEILKKIMNDRMYPLTLEGLDRGMKALKHKN